ncbi:MAG: hypothetical protein ACOY3Y_07425 [Acidobacteriota bacterium]
MVAQRWLGELLAHFSSEKPLQRPHLFQNTSWRSRRRKTKSLAFLQRERIRSSAALVSCDYCRTDSLVTRLSSSRRRWLEELRREVRQQLGAAVDAITNQRAERKLLRIITIVVLVACWLGFWFALPH